MNFEIRSCSKKTSDAHIIRLKILLGKGLVTLMHLQVYDIIQRERRPVSMVRFTAFHISFFWDYILSPETCLGLRTP